jgi:hypothetical protein
MLQSLVARCGLPTGTLKLTLPSPTAITATPSPTATMSAAEKAVSPKVVSKVTFAEKLTADQQMSVRSGYAAAAGGVPIENVEMTQVRRAVSYTVTVFVKDSAAANAVMTKLSDTSALKTALKTAVPDPRTCVCVCVLCVCAYVLGTWTNTPSTFPVPGSSRLHRRICQN